MLKAIVGSSVAIPLSALTEFDVEALKVDLTLKKRSTPSFAFGHKQDKISDFVFFYRIDQGYIILPRRFGIEYCAKKNIPVEDRRCDGDKIQIKFNEEMQRGKMELKVIQDPIVDDVIRGMTFDGSHSGLLQAGTGTGKTVMGSKIISHFGRRTLIVVHTEFLMNQWRNELMMFTDLKEDEIGFIQQDVRDTSNKKVVIGMVQTLIKREFTPQERKAFGLVMYDECHHLPAEEFSGAMLKFDAKYALGLSATPKRFDGMDLLLGYGLGPRLNENAAAPQMVPDIYIRAFQCSIPESKYMQMAEFQGKRQRVANLAKLTNEVVKIGERNGFILNIILQAAKRDRKIMVFSSRIAQLKALKAAFDLQMNTGLTAMFIGGMKEAEIEAAKKRQIMFCTYQYAAEALNVPDRDCLVLATPISNVRQVIGRILRVHEGKKNPIVVDILDEGVHKLETMQSTRAREYKAMRANVHLPNGQLTR